MKTAFIGLGVMGGPMASHLSKAGYEVNVYNRTHEKAERHVDDNGGTLCETPAIAAANADIVFACVGNDDDVRSVTSGDEGAFATMKAGSIFVDHTTTSAELAIECATHAKNKGIEFLDAPVSGGEAGAVNGALTIMIGGAEEAYNAIAPVIDCYAKMHKLMGPCGAGQKTKMVNQIAIAGLVQGLSEAINFAQHADLNAEDVVEVISKGAAQSWQMENRYKTMIAGEFDFGFAVNWMRKDLTICFEEADRNGAALPVARLVDGFYEEVQALGGQRWDTSSLIEVVRANSKK
ncbi:MAG: oxidoreductase [Rhizobiales bacterium TMED249]|uniref:NAD(P)-dependent oxidoreductase n=1 Tax=PS1 clade bacterium TaxID=2175152 RepID=A0A368E0F4_9PROT|nr:MAG: oxidoreductase [Rhizobiales bacterium TMED249]RCL77567.1 MAG: NAD(P)-dependent oxidoreductase [PS1 clade bacterium]HCV48840.1 oxidoreductase [Rhodobiaceae bacterium]|tara:strand:+ start:7531 stop:8406 length:876 start_codon:yes stop_codon:yes gene_type:complete